MLTAYLMLITLLGAIDTGSAVQPIVVPQSVIAQVGTVARFNCTAVHDDPVYWSTKPYGSASTYDIYIGEKLLVEDYGRSGRFSVEVNKILRRHDLIINKTKQTDGGAYICIDERGLGRKAYAELVVWDMLICQEEQRQESYMGDNVFDIDQDVIRFTCRINYTGNLRPRLEWSVDGRKLKRSQGTESGIVSSSLTLVATNKLNGANVTCEAVIQNHSHDDARTGVLWTSEAIRVKYAVMKQKVVEECPGVEQTLDCNPPCSYKLETVNGTQRCAMNYSSETDVNLFHFYEYSAHSSECGNSSSLVALTVSSIVFCVGGSLLTVLFIGCLMKIKCFRKKARSLLMNRPLH